MNDSPISPDDPRLTAYALGEIEDADRVAVEAALAANPALRVIVDEIRATVVQLTSALAAEPKLEVAPTAAEEARESAQAERRHRTRPTFWAKLLRLPQSYYLIGTLSAAAFAVLVWRYQPEAHLPLAQKKYVEVTLPAAAEAAAANGVGGADRERASLAGGAVGSAAAPAVVSLAPMLDEKREEQRADAVSQLSSAIGAVAKEAKDGALVRDSAIANAATFNQVAPAPTDQLAAITDGAPRRQIAETAVDKSTANKADGSGAATLSAFSVAPPASPKLAAASSRYGGSDGRVLSSAKPMAMAVERALNTESYGLRHDNEFVAVTAEPLSTFSIDVDTASYSNVRRFLRSGRLPPRDAVRIEELVNYFPYRYAPPTNGAPFAASLEVATAPWAPTHRLVRIGLKGREVSAATRPAANLVFLLDVSGSMNEPNKLPLVKESMRLLVNRLRPDDQVAIVTYAGQSGLALASTPVRKSREIMSALDELAAGGSTNGAMGIQLAYDIAKANFVPGGVNRVILCTDGDFNVGVTDRGELARLVEEKAKANVFLTVLGFGMGNLKDETLETLADKGNGNYGYIDTRREAEKLLVEQVNGTLVTIAKDVKIQVEFNPAQVSAYRLIGYENRMLRKEDFNNDKVDAGEIGAGHTVTALYEVIPASADETAPVVSVDDLKYQRTDSGSRKSEAARKSELASRDEEASRELLTVKIRYKEPTDDVSKKLEFPLVDAGRAFAAASGDFKFAAAVAGFGMALRSEPTKGSLLADVAGWAEESAGDDAGGYRAEFGELVRQARALVQ